MPTIVKTACLLPNTLSRRTEESYTPTICTVCGNTHEEVHEMIKALHYPTNPSKCYFRGPKFMTEKHIQEGVMQYIVKHPGPRKISENTA